MRWVLPKDYYSETFSIFMFPSWFKKTLRLMLSSFY